MNLKIVILRELGHIYYAISIKFNNSIFTNKIQIIWKVKKGNENEHKENFGVINIFIV